MCIKSSHPNFEVTVYFIPNITSNGNRMDTCTFSVMPCLTDILCNNLVILKSQMGPLCLIFYTI